MVFETINSTNLPAISPFFNLTEDWHHFGKLQQLQLKQWKEYVVQGKINSTIIAVTGDNARRVITFYLDGKQLVSSDIKNVIISKRVCE